MRTAPGSQAALVVIFVTATSAERALAVSRDPTLCPRCSCQAQSSHQEAPSTARLTEVTAARAVTGGRPVGTEAVFAPDANPIYVWFKHEGLPPGTTVTSRWYYLGAAPPLLAAEDALSLSTGDWADFSLELAAGKRWPAGSYRVDLLIGGSLAGEARFTVVDSATPDSPIAERAYTHPRTGFQLSVPPGWTTNDQVAHADLQMTPAQGEGLIEVTSGPTPVRLDPASYAAGWESSAVGPGGRLKSKRAGQVLPGDVARGPAYAGVYEGDGVLAKVLFLSTPDRFFVMTGVFKSADFEEGERIFDRVAQTLRMRRLDD